MNRIQAIIALAMLFLCALPDAMVVPVLRQLMVDRYGVTVGAAHAFMWVNLVGAMVCVRFIRSWQHRFGDRWLLVSAAFLNGALLAAIALPIGFGPTLALRAFEGAADLIVYAVLFNRISQLGSPATRGRRMGLAATSMMLGIAGGIGIGGLVGSRDATLSLWLGAAACTIVALIALLSLRRRTDNPDIAHPRAATLALPPAAQLLSPPLVMMFSDRAVASLLATTVPLYMTSVAGFSTARTGALVGICMLMTALGAWPAGRLVDLLGCNTMRRIAGGMYAAGVLAIPAMVSMHPAILWAGMIVIGLGGAILFASSLVAIAATDRGAGAMGAYHAAGNLGFLLGTLTAGLLISILGDADQTAYVTVFAGFSLFHVAMTALTVVGREPIVASLASRVRKAPSPPPAG